MKKIVTLQFVLALLLLLLAPFFSHLARQNARTSFNIFSVYFVATLPYFFMGMILSIPKVMMLKKCKLNYKIIGLELLFILLMVLHLKFGVLHIPFLPVSSVTYIYPCSFAFGFFLINCFRCGD